MNDSFKTSILSITFTTIYAWKFQWNWSCLLKHPTYMLTHTYIHSTLCKVVVNAKSLWWHIPTERHPQANTYLSSSQLPYASHKGN